MLISLLFVQKLSLALSLPFVIVSWLVLTYLIAAAAGENMEYAYYNVVQELIYKSNMMIIVFEPHDCREDLLVWRDTGRE